MCCWCCIVRSFHRKFNIVAVDVYPIVCSLIYFTKNGVKDPNDLYSDAALPGCTTDIGEST